MSDGIVTTTTPGGPAVAPGTKTIGRKRKLYGLMAEFGTPAEIYHAAERVRSEGYKWFDCFVPFPVHGLDKAMGVKPTILPILVFFAGATGTMLAVLLQWFTNGTSFEIWALVPVIGYDFMISGKPYSSIPAWIPVLFELTVLFSAGTAFLLAFVMNGLPRFHHPVFRVPSFARATDDRFFLLIESRDPQFYRDTTEEFLRSLKPIALEEVQD